MPTKSQTVAGDVATLLRSNNPLLWIVTREEPRVEAYIFEAAASAGFVTRTWDVQQGVLDMSGRPMAAFQDPDPVQVMTAIKAQADSKQERCVWIMRDLHPWLAPPQGAVTLRALRNLTRHLAIVDRKYAQSVIVLSPSGDVPADLQGDATVVDWPLPDRDEIAAILDAAVTALPEERQADARPNGNRDAAIDAAVGLSEAEAAACYRRSLYSTRRIDVSLIAKSKKQVFAKERLLEFYDPIPGGLDAVGGLSVLKDWLVSRSAAYTPQARAYGLPAPRGVLVVGVSGCGKSLGGKALATGWNVPLVRFDLGALLNKFVGQSQENIRRVLKVLEAIGPHILWLDEVEKQLGGASQGAADGGVSSDQLGTLLQWMQERRGSSFIYCTSNDVRGLPPEFLRRGRFDEVFFVDLPQLSERVEIVRAALREYRRPADCVDARTVAAACDGFTGAEIAALVPDAMYAAYADNARQITTSDLCDAARRVVPLSKTASEKIADLRQWAKTRARNASAQEMPQGVEPLRRVATID